MKEEEVPATFVSDTPAETFSRPIPPKKQQPKIQEDAKQSKAKVTQNKK